MPASRIGIEYAFLPSSGLLSLQRRLPDANLLDALHVLERLRARKTAAELDDLRLASDRVVDAMLATLKQIGEGSTKNEIVRLIKEEEVSRGLNFEYCLIAMGSSFNRAPSDQRWQPGEPLSLDSGGNYAGYIGDVARMAVLGEPDAELVDLLGEIEEIQMQARSVVAPGVIGRTIYEAVSAPLKNSPNNRISSLLRSWNGAHYPRGAASHEHGSGSLRSDRCGSSAGGGHGHLDRNDAAASEARLHQVGGHYRGHGRELRSIWRSRSRVERGHLMLQCNNAPV